MSDAPMKPVADDNGLSFFARNAAESGRYCIPGSRYGERYFGHSGCWPATERIVRRGYATVELKRLAQSADGLWEDEVKW